MFLLCIFPYQKCRFANFRKLPVLVLGFRWCKGVFWCENAWNAFEMCLESLENYLKGSFRRGVRTAFALFSLKKVVFSVFFVAFFLRESNFRKLPSWVQKPLFYPIFHTIILRNDFIWLFGRFEFIFFIYLQQIIAFQLVL